MDPNIVQFIVIVIISSGMKFFNVGLFFSAYLICQTKIAEYSVFTVYAKDCFTVVYGFFSSCYVQTAEWDMQSAMQLLDQRNNQDKDPLTCFPIQGTQPWTQLTTQVGNTQCVKALTIYLVAKFIFTVFTFAFKLLCFILSLSHRSKHPSPFIWGFPSLNQW